MTTPEARAGANIDDLLTAVKAIYRLVKHSNACQELFLIEQELDGSLAPQGALCASSRGTSRGV